MITYGTFDLFHVGHVNLFKRAKALGERLIVAVSTDDFNREKGKMTLVPFKHRCAVVESCRYVDDVVPESSWQQKVGDVERYGVDILVMGSDWEGKFDELKDLCEVIYLPRTQGISSSVIKQAMTIISQVERELS